MSWRLATQLTFFLLMSLKWLYCILDDLATLMVFYFCWGALFVFGYALVMVSL